MNDPARGLAAKDAEFAPVLDDLQANLDATLGPLEWESRRPAAVTHLVDGYDVTRVGPIAGRGVMLPGLGLDAMQATIESTIQPHGFATTQDLRGSQSGTLIYKATDVDGATLTVTCKATLNAWVDVRIR